MAQIQFTGLNDNQIAAIPTALNLLSPALVQSGTNNNGTSVTYTVDRVITSDEQTTLRNYLAQQAIGITAS